MTNTINKNQLPTLTNSDIGLGNVTNDLQAKASIVPNTAPSAAQIMVGNAGGTAYAAVSLTGPVSITADGLTAVSGLPPTGSIQMFGSTTAPTGWLSCKGDAVSRTTYANLFAVIGTSFGSGNGSTTFNIPNISSRVPVGYVDFTLMGTVTFTVSTHVVNLTAHGLSDGQIVLFSTAGTIPSGITIGQRYYVINCTANTFQVAATRGGSAILFTTAGFGDIYCNSADFEFATSGGEISHKNTVAETAAHPHTWTTYQSNGNYTSPGSPIAMDGVGGTNTTKTTTSTGGDMRHYNLQPYIALNFIIKT